MLITREKVPDFCFEHVCEVLLRHSRDDGCMDLISEQSSGLDTPWE